MFFASPYNGLTVASYAGYGLTEMSPVALLLLSDQFLSKAGSAGVLLPNLEARLVGNGGVDVKPGEPGELWLRGPTVMKVEQGPVVPERVRFTVLLGLPE